MPLSPLMVLVGPTASGKTAMSIALARAFSGEIIAADSRTIYQEMDIGTAKPEQDKENGEIWSGDLKTQLFREKPLMHQGVPHWGLNMRMPEEPFTASEYQGYADKKIKEIQERGNLPILVGGTGLYVAAVVDRPSFAEVPPDPALRLELAIKSNEELLEEIAERDPDTAERIDAKNRRRLERAIEILRATGRRLAEVQKREEPIYSVCMLGVDVPREALYERIDARVDAMIAEGLVDEIRHLREKYGDEAPGMTGIGYRQIVAFLQGKMPLRESVIRIKQDTRQYAKRQMTWFQRDDRIQWVKTTSEALEKVAAWQKEKHPMH
ncbi:tRNA (adenosine(37)-N6)-dimethylallyltransferase MiaA [bacterium]|nr:tRNA (adenosine(37)-N6)-dimethylallyltransferase MiaA [bacterium]